MSHKELSEKIKEISFAVLTISDKRKEEEDYSGKLIIKNLKNEGYKIGYYNILKNEIDIIRKEIKKIIGKVDVIITCGGTGISKRDITIEAVLPIISKKIDGFGEFFRALSYKEIETRAMMSRALAGTVDGKIIICLPGSKNAVQIAIKKLIIPEIKHLIWEVRR
ncbi:MAG: MogA/MoaB family molybdenum cofactor biosynthesis protein [Candidatus Thermoplasmatota archaeon]